MSDDTWRKNGTCGACSHFTRDFGQAPVLYGHCKMYPRNASRTTNDSTCHEFKPLDGFEEKVVLAVRTHVPESRRAERRPVDVDVGSVVRRPLGDDGPSTVIKRRRDGDEVEVVSEATRQFFQPPAGGTAQRSVLDGNGGDGDDAPAPTAPSAAASGAIAGALADPGGGVDPQQMEEAMLDVVESFAALSDISLSEYSGGLMLLRPADPELKAHELEIDAFFQKFVMIRDRLRVLEQKVNAHDVLSNLEKIELHVPITRVYGALTGFNSLFRPSARGWRQRRPTRRPLEELLRRHAPRESVELAAKFVGGICRIQGAPASGEDAIDISIDLLFDRVCRLKRKMRDLERSLKAHPKLTGDDKTTLLDYLSKCHGSLTTFNVLFRHRDDWFSSK